MVKIWLNTPDFFCTIRGSTSFMLIDNKFFRTITG